MFPYSKAYRMRKYEQYEEILVKKKEIVMELKEKIKKEYSKKNKEHLTTAFLTFATNYQKNVLLEFNSDSWLEKVKRFLPFFSQKERLVIEKDGEKYDDLRILPGPDPEDIVWRNIGVSRK